MADDEDNYEIDEISFSENQDSDKFWKQWGKDSINTSLGKLDDRAQFMITTCAGLIVADFGLNAYLNIFDVLSVIPQFLFVLSTLFFAASYFPRSQLFHFDRPETLKKNYDDSFSWKIKWQYAGYAVFLIGLIFIIISYMVKIPTINIIFS